MAKKNDIAKQLHRISVKIGTMSATFRNIADLVPSEDMGRLVCPLTEETLSGYGLILQDIQDELNDVFM